MKKVKIPVKYVNVLAHKYSIESTSNLSDEELGRCHTTEQRIFVRDDIPGDSMRDVTLHELMHAVHFHMELNDGSTEESFTSRTATGLRTVLVNNPTLCRWIFQPSKN